MSDGLKMKMGPTETMDMLRRATDLVRGMSDHLGGISNLVEGFGLDDGAFKAFVEETTTRMLASAEKSHPDHAESIATMMCAAFANGYFHGTVAMASGALGAMAMGIGVEDIVGAVDKADMH